MKKQILEELKKIKSDNQVRILYAIESGSRGWGFASTDSDYDVRFIYARNKDWYISIEDNRSDVIERPITDELDINGWDIRKALQLFRKSNPPLLEWLSSPILYLEQGSFINNLRKLTEEYFSPKSCMYHYLSMGKGNCKDYLKGDTVKLKKYFYMLRPILACQWIEENDTMPPMEFEILLNAQMKDGELKDEILKLLNRKRNSSEIGIESQIPIINNFLWEKVKYYEHFTKNFPDNEQLSVEKLNKILQETLLEEN